MILLFFLVTFVCILTNPNEALRLAECGLSLWFHRMIPTLLPFMILSGTMIRQGSANRLSRILRPILQPLFRISDSCLYAILVGMLCGFPMGAKTVADLIEQKQITKREGDYLLSFVNQIGPIYFIGYVLPLLGLTPHWPYLLGMYGIPLLYGVFLRLFFYNHLPLQSTSSAQAALPLAQALEKSVESAVTGMLNLGGYMIFFQLLNLLPALLCPRLLPILSPLFEINGGLQLLGDTCPTYSLILVVFGGLCCLLQTYSCIKETGCSLQNYIKHKSILTILTAIYYLYLSYLR